MSKLATMNHNISIYFIEPNTEWYVEVGPVEVLYEIL